MTKKNLLVVAVAVLAFGGVLSLFEDKPDKAAADGPKPSASAPVAVSQQPTSEAPQPSVIPSPDQAQTVALVAALRAVDAGLVTKEVRAVDRARSTCQEIRAGKDAATVQKNTRGRFEGGSVTLTDDQAAQIVKAVQGSFCP